MYRSRVLLIQPDLLTLIAPFRLARLYLLESVAL